LRRLRSNRLETTARTTGFETGARAPSSTNDAVPN
jgi:hypothetical protein